MMMMTIELTHMYCHRGCSCAGSTSRCEGTPAHTSVSWVVMSMPYINRYLGTFVRGLLVLYRAGWSVMGQAVQGLQGCHREDSNQVPVGVCLTSSPLTSTSGSDGMVYAGGLKEWETRLTPTHLVSESHFGRCREQTNHRHPPR